MMRLFRARTAPNEALESRRQQIGRELTEYAKIRSGGVGERLKPAVLKTVRPERVSGVQIPPPPPYLRNTIKTRVFTACYSRDTLFTWQGSIFAAKYPEGAGAIPLPQKA